MVKDMIFDICALIGVIGLMFCLASCNRNVVEVPSAYLEPCYSQHCNKGDRACDCLSESRACQNKLNKQLIKIKELQ